MHLVEIVGVAVCNTGYACITKAFIIAVCRLIIMVASWTLRVPVFRSVVCDAVLTCLPGM